MASDVLITEGILVTVQGRYPLHRDTCACLSNGFCNCDKGRTGTAPTITTEPLVSLGDNLPKHRSSCDKITVGSFCNCDNGQGQEAPHPIDLIRHPPHYIQHPSGVECIDITRHMNFNLGNVIKYVWRSDLKGHTIEDLEKAAFYLNDEISRLKESKP